MEKLLDLVDISGKAVEKYDDVKTYVSTGAVDTNYIDAEKCEVYSFSNKPSRANLQVNDGDIIFAKMQGTKKTLIIDKENEKYIYSTGFCSIKPKTDRIIEKFLYYLLSSEIFLKEKDKNCTGATQKAITNEGLGKIYIKVPSISDQERLVKLLDRISLINESYNKQTTYLDTLIKARFVEMFGDLNNTKYDIKTIEECAIFVKDGTHNTPMYTEDKVNGFKFLSSKDVTSGKIDWSNIKYIPKELHNELYERIKPQKNDILLAKNGTTGICAIVDNDEIFDIYVSLALIRLKEDLNPTYIWTIINSYMVKEQFNKSLKGIGVPNLHLSEIKKVNLIVPPIGLQNSFAAFVNQVDKLKFA